MMNDCGPLWLSRSLARMPQVSLGSRLRKKVKLIFHSSLTRALPGLANEEHISKEEDGERTSLDKEQRSEAHRTGTLH